MTPVPATITIRIRDIDAPYGTGTTIKFVTDDSGTALDKVAELIVSTSDGSGER